jgi:hypothetical protein
MKKIKLINIRIGYILNNINYVKRYIHPKSYIFKMSSFQLIDYLTEIIKITHNNQDITNIEIITIIISDDIDNIITILTPNMYGLYDDLF